MTVFKEFYGEKLNSSEEIMMTKSYQIALMQRKYDAYVNFTNIHLEMEALDALISGITTYDYVTGQVEDLYVKGELTEDSRVEILNEITLIKDNIIQILDEKYSLSEEQAREILNSPDELSYTKALNSIIKSSSSDLDSDSEIEN